MSQEFQISIINRSGKLASNTKKEDTVKVHLPSRLLHGSISRVNETSKCRQEFPIPNPNTPAVHNRVTNVRNHETFKLKENREIQTHNTQSTITKEPSSENQLQIEVSIDSFNLDALKESVDAEKVSGYSSQVSSDVTDENERLWKLKAENAREEADERAEVIKALKKKVAELHMKLHEELHEKNNEKEKSRLLQGDNEELKKNLEWHKKQLYECQVARDRFQKELTQEKQRLPQSVNSECLSSSISLKEGTTKSKRSETLHEKVASAESIRETVKKEITNIQEKVECSKKWAKEEKATWEALVAELEEQIKVWKEEAQSLSDAVAKGEKERATWLGRIAELQERLGEKVTELDRSKEKLKESEEMLSREKSNRRLVEAEREELRANLLSTRNEKKILDKAVEVIKDDFSRVRKSFEIIKSKLAQKERRVSELEAACQKYEYRKLVIEESHRKPKDIPTEGKVTEGILSEFDTSLQDNEEEQFDESVNIIKSESCRNVSLAADDKDPKVTIRPSFESQSSMIVVSPCCLAAMERVDMEWRQKQKISIPVVMKEKTQDIKITVGYEKEQGLTPRQYGEFFSKPITSFSALPVPTKFNDTAIMELVKESENVIHKRNCSMDILKNSLSSLEEEVTSLENQLKFSFLAFQKHSTIKAAN